jgi:hypothetical protein
VGYIFFSARFSKEIRELSQDPNTFFILPAVFLALGFLLPKVVSREDEEELPRKYLKNTLLSSILLMGGFTLGLSIAVVFPQMIMLTLIASVLVTVQAIHLNVGARIFTREKK